MPARSCPRCALPSTGRRGRRAGASLVSRFTPIPAFSLRTGQGLPGFLANHPVALRRSPTPDDPWRLAIRGASGAAPTLSRMRASTMLFRGSMASLHHPLCTLHDVRCRTPCNTRFRLAGCAFAGRESNPLARDEGFLAHCFLPSRTSPGATTIWVRAARRSRARRARSAQAAQDRDRRRQCRIAECDRRRKGGLTAFSRTTGRGRGMPIPARAGCAGTGAT